MNRIQWMLNTGMYLRWINDVCIAHVCISRTYGSRNTYPELLRNEHCHRPRGHHLRVLAQRNLRCSHFVTSWSFELLRSATARS